MNKRCRQHQHSLGSAGAGGRGAQVARAPSCTRNNGAGPSTPQAAGCPGATAASPGHGRKKPPMGRSAVPVPPGECTPLRQRGHDSLRTVMQFSGGPHGEAGCVVTGWATCLGRRGEASAWFPSARLGGSSRRDLNAGRPYPEVTQRMSLVNGERPASW